MDNKTLISTLIASYSGQLDLYRALNALVQKTLSQVVLTRGDMSGLRDNFARKQQLLDGIMTMRAQSEETVKLWQERKAGIPQDSRTQDLDALLASTQLVIKDFLDGEEQLKKYLEHVVRKGSTVL